MAPTCRGNGTEVIEIRRVLIPVFQSFIGGSALRSGAHPETFPQVLWSNRYAEVWPQTHGVSPFSPGFDRCWLCSCGVTRRSEASRGARACDPAPGLCR